MTIVSKKPAYTVTVRDIFWCFLLAEVAPARLYENTVLRMAVVKSLTLAKTVASLDIYASGIAYDSVNRAQGGEISLTSVAIPQEIIDRAVGAITKDALTSYGTADVALEFAFGYYLEESDGGLVYYWHPRCKLVPSDDTAETSTDSATDPAKEMTIKCLPTSEGIWGYKYVTAAASGTPLTVEEFFAFVRYTNSIQASCITIAEPVAAAACASTLSYADNETPVSPTITYQWYIAATQGGEYAEIEDEDGASYTPAAEDVGKYIKCRSLISGSATGYVESDPKLVAAA